ncbi:sugar phosphate isomerase/epimerase family protein [Evansella cellulosilytica]|uniref:Xylose isomerase domain-containing protein TIM barrel n=1 Tax=Evansella cellulosilytica (strain ATCC 21833 / DSM 2522 / FERM P-1141 / JCM 9156 / N-4) TaxID=649639 RepID=E6TUY7_EVAC2|nr:TIM barrel protein [Evansella cellulosilytica]ADU28570.1 Xylose isomerase domain-containing protein TIM barrel [Evansella cellulosilytica DSM 2522]
MRLGGPVFFKNHDAESWAEAVKVEGYRAALCPVNYEDGEETINAYKRSAIKNDIVIAEVGAWSNPISPDDEMRRSAIEHCKRQLELAEMLEAKCCVNIAGSRGEQWDGPHVDNFSDDTFTLIVDTVREIIDAVQPKHTFYTLEMMPWVYPDSSDTYLALIKAIERDAFAVHYDPVNIITSPRNYYNNKNMIRDFFKKLSPYIKNCHAKDINLLGKLTVHLEEVIPGKGLLHYQTLLTELNKLDKDTPLIIEHLSTEAEYREAANYIRSVANTMNIDL